jgi:hypothetical protein
MKKGQLKSWPCFVTLFRLLRKLTLAVAASLAAHHRRALSVTSGYIGLDAPAQPFCKLVPCAPQTRL